MKRGATAAIVATAAAFAFALGLRAWHIGWGLPFNYDPWEQEALGHALDMARRGSLDPEWMAWPSGSLYLTLGSVRVLNWLAGLPIAGVDARSASPGMLVAGQEAFLLAARLLVAVLGALLAAAAARAAWRLAGRAIAAWVAGFLAAALPVLVEASHRIGPSGPAALGVGLTLWAAVVLVQPRARPEHAFWAGGALGLAAGFHYAASLAAVPVLIAALRGPGWGRRLSNVALAGAAALGAFLITTPYAVARPIAVARAWLAEGPVASSAGWLEALADPGGIGPIPLLVAGASLAFLVSPRVRAELGAAIAVLAALLPAMAVGGALGLPGDVLAALSAPAIALLAGASVAAAAVAFERGWLTNVFGVIMLAAIAPVALAGGTTAWARGAERTESLAFDWFHREVPAGARVIREWDGPHLPSGRFQVLALDDIGRVSAERLAELDPDYVVLGDRSLAGEGGRSDVARQLLESSHPAVVFCADPPDTAGPQLVVVPYSSRARALHPDSSTYGPCRPSHP